jgi:hypothetical protein
VLFLVHTIEVSASVLDGRSASDMPKAAEYGKSACTSSEGTEKAGRCDHDAVLDYLSSDPRRWDAFVAKVAAADRGAANTAALLLPFADGSKRTDILRSFQDALVVDPEFVVVLLLSKSTGIDEVCGPSLHDTYDLRRNSVEARIGSLSVLHWELRQRAKASSATLDAIDKCIGTLEKVLRKEQD